MTTRAPVALAILALASGCRAPHHAPESAPPAASSSEAKAQESVEDDWSAESADLTPVEGRGYQYAVREFLLGEARACVSMVCTPSFSPEYLVAIVDAGGPDTTAQPQARSHSILTAAPLKQIWPHTEKRDFRYMKVERFQVPIDDDSAQVIIDAWESVVRRTRYPKPHYLFDEDGRRLESISVGMDGTTYVFDAERFRGEAWSPKGGLPARLVRLAEELRTFAQTDESQRAAHLARCLEFAKSLQAAAEKRPW
jgi:hypothetical protein